MSNDAASYRRSVGLSVTGSRSTDLLFEDPFRILEPASVPATAASRHLPSISERSDFLGEEQQPGFDLPDSQDIMRVPKFAG
jgi:hypothetical protein